MQWDATVGFFTGSVDRRARAAYGRDIDRIAIRRAAMSQFASPCGIRRDPYLRRSLVYTSGSTGDVPTSRHEGTCGNQGAR